MHHRIELETGVIKLTPYALALTSHDLRKAAESILTERFPVTPMLLHAMSIEIGLKAAILNYDCSSEKKDWLKYKIGHDLLKTHEHYVAIYHGELLNATDLCALGKLNQFFKGKQLEYFTIEMIVEAGKAFKSFPTLIEVSACNGKVSAMLTTNNNFQF